MAKYPVLAVLCITVLILFAVLIPTTAAPPLIGTATWTTLLCKFSDAPTEPFTPQGVQAQFGSAYPGISDYWRIQSNNTLTLATQTLGWYSLPHTQSDYVNMGTDAGRTALLADCLQAAALTDTVDTVTAVITNTETPLSGYINEDVVINPSSIINTAALVRISGQALGLKSSTGSMLNTANPWDAISIPAPLCGTMCTIPHITAYAKSQAGWLTASATHPNATTESVYTIAYLDIAAGDNVHLLSIPHGAQLYTLEARRTSEDYTLMASGQTALVIHRVDPAAPIPIALYATLEAVDATLTLTDAALSVQIERITTDSIQVRVKPVSTEPPTPDVTPEVTPETTPDPTPDPATPTPPAPLNYVQNGSFEDKNTASLPLAWAKYKLTQDLVMCNTPEKTLANSGECAFRFRGSTGENSQLSQKLILPGVARGTLLEINLKALSQKLTRGVVIQLLVYYIDPTLSPENITLRSGAGFGEYRHIGASLELAGEVSYALLKLTYTEQKGVVWVDDITITLR